MRLFLLSLSLYGSEWVGPASHRGLEMLVGPQADSLSQCHETYAPSVFYGATLEFRAKRGRVRRVRVRQANQDLPELERCLRQAAGRWRVSETVDASMSWPVVLLPADATLAGEQPSLTLGQEGVFAAALAGRRRRTFACAGSTAGLLLVRITAVLIGGVNSRVLPNWRRSCRIWVLARGPRASFGSAADR